MISGDDRRAVIECDWPGCLASLEMDNVDSKTPALGDMRPIAAKHYGWRVATIEAGYGQRQSVTLDVCPEHDAPAEWLTE